MKNIMIAAAALALSFPLSAQEYEHEEGKGTMRRTRTEEQHRKEARQPVVEHEEGKGSPRPVPALPAQEPASNISPEPAINEASPDCDGSFYGICKSFAWRALSAMRAATQQAAGEKKSVVQAVQLKPQPSVEPVYKHEEGKGNMFREQRGRRDSTPAETETKEPYQHPETKGTISPDPESNESVPEPEAPSPRYEHEEGKGRY